MIATERIRILQAIEYPNSTRETHISAESHPTIWNQMEAAMAYSNNIPILIFVQRGLKRQGMLSDRLEWVAIEADLSPDILQTEKFRQIFDAWLQLIAKKAKSKSEGWEIENLPDIKLRTLINFLARLSTKQAWAVLIVAFSIISGVATTAFKLGQTFPSPSNVIKSSTSN